MQAFEQFKEDQDDDNMAVDVTNVQAKLHMNRSRNIVKVFKLKKIIMHEIEKMNSDANISLSGSDLNNFT